MKRGTGQGYFESFPPLLNVAWCIKSRSERRSTIYSSSWAQLEVRVVEKKIPTQSASLIRSSMQWVFCNEHFSLSIATIHPIQGKCSMLPSGKLQYHRLVILNTKLQCIEWWHSCPITHSGLSIHTAPRAEYNLIEQVVDWRFSRSPNKQGAPSEKGVLPCVRVSPQSITVSSTCCWFGLLLFKPNLKNSADTHPHQTPQTTAEGTVTFPSLSHKNTLNKANVQVAAPHLFASSFWPPLRDTCGELHLITRYV